MSHSNGIMRDPVIMINKSVAHYRRNLRHVYPLYDFISPIMDSLLGITHVFRTNEFAERGELHMWILDQLGLRAIKYNTFCGLIWSILYCLKGDCEI